MNENLINELKAAEQILGSLPVTYEAQDAVVAVKVKIRKVMAELSKKEVAEHGG